MIPLVDTLDKKIAQTTSLQLRAELTAERASYLARAGDFVGAEASINEIRETQGYDAGVRVLVRIMICEGLLIYFQGTGLDARDRLIRAKALAKAAGESDLNLLAAAWLAHIDLNRSDYTSMSGYLQECFAGTSDRPVISALTRAEILMGDLSTYCGRTGDAKYWYRRALAHAVQQGDQLSIEAVMFNRTAYRLAHVRSLQAVGLAVGESELFTRMEVTSASSFYNAVGYSSLGHLLLGLQARADLHFRDFGSAAEKFRQLVEAGVSVSYQSDQLLLKSEFGVCLLLSGNLAEAARAWNEIKAVDDPSLGPDDEMCFFVNLMQLGEILGASESWLNAVKVRLAVAQEKYRNELRNVELLLDDLSSVWASGCGKET